MKAFRNLGGVINEIDVDVDVNGAPILPPDTTVAARPEALEGHYVTVVGTEWVQIPVPVPFVTFEHKKAQALEKVAAYRAWYIDQPVEHSGVMFDADDQARDRLTQTVVMNGAVGYLPLFWVTYDNTPFPIADLPALLGIVGAVQNAFATRFFECNTIRQTVLGATTEAELDLVEIPKPASAF